MHISRITADAFPAAAQHRVWLEALAGISLRNRDLTVSLSSGRLVHTVPLLPEVLAELRVLPLVVAGARADLGQLEQALAVLGSPAPDPEAVGSTAARLAYAYADTLVALDRREEALQWFLRAADADVEGVTDAEDRVEELS